VVPYRGGVRELCVTAVGKDRPGIVAALTGGLLEVGGNLEDCRAALLHGSFAIVLAVAVPDAVGVEEVERALAPAAARLGLTLAVGPGEPDAGGAGGERCVVSVYGADRPGIVHAVTTAVAERAGNVLDLSSRVVGDPPLYVLGIEVELPEGLTARALRDHLAPVAAARGLELAVEPESEQVI
jgi:glycine cleavage system transcriptional repressor